MSDETEIERLKGLIAQGNRTVAALVALAGGKITVPQRLIDDGPSETWGSVSHDPPGVTLSVTLPAWMSEDG